MRVAERKGERNDEREQTKPKFQDTARTFKEIFYLLLCRYITLKARDCALERGETDQTMGANLELGELCEGDTEYFFARCSPLGVLAGS